MHPIPYTKCGALRGRVAGSNHASEESCGKVEKGLLTVENGRETAMQVFSLINSLIVKGMFTFTEQQILQLTDTF